MKAKLIDKLLTTLLVVIMLINAFILTQTWFSMNASAVVLRENKVSYILPDGFTPEKTRITWDDSLPASSGWVVRYTSKGCTYCAQDSEWERLVLLLERHNYRTVLLLPTEKNKYDEDEQTLQQMAFVKMDWIKQFRFTGTPTVVVFDNSGRVLWHRVGMLNESDYESAVKIIVKNAKG